MSNLHGGIIRERREALGWTHWQVVDRLPGLLSVDELREIEDGVRELYDTELIPLAQVLGFQPFAHLEFDSIKK